MKRYIKQIISIFMLVAMFVGLTGCGVVNSARRNTTNWLRWCRACSPRRPIFSW